MMGSEWRILVRPVDQGRGEAVLSGEGLKRSNFSTPSHPALVNGPGNLTDTYLG
jgi:hypothetical protein